MRIPSFPSTLLLKRLSFIQYTFLVSSLRISGYRWVSLFLDSAFCFYANTIQLWLLWLIVYLEIRICDVSSFAFFSSRLLGL
jgi:hypothetical protein